FVTTTPGSYSNICVTKTKSLYYQIHNSSFYDNDLPGRFPFQVFQNILMAQYRLFNGFFVEVKRQRNFSTHFSVNGNRVAKFALCSLPRIELRKSRITDTTRFISQQRPKLFCNVRCIRG